MGLGTTVKLQQSVGHHPIVSNRVICLCILMSVKYLGFLLMAVLLVAYANGANDNYKGVVTLFRSGLTFVISPMGLASLRHRAKTFEC